MDRVNAGFEGERTDGMREGGVEMTQEELEERSAELKAEKARLEAEVKRLEAKAAWLEEAVRKAWAVRQRMMWMLIKRLESMGFFIR